MIVGDGGGAATFESASVFAIAKSSSSESCLRAGAANSISPSTRDPAKVPESLERRAPLESTCISAERLVGAASPEPAVAIPNDASVGSRSALASVKGPDMTGPSPAAVGCTTPRQSRVAPARASFALASNP